MAETKPDPKTQSLVVFAAREGEEGDLWNNDYGLLPVPDDWEFLSAGQAFVTRTVKSLGPAWVLLKPVRKQRYKQTLGVYAPAVNVRRAHALAEETSAEREEKRRQSEKLRARKEDRYRAQFRQAVLDYLDFLPEFRKLADKIAGGIVEHTCRVGGGTVGRSWKLDFESKVFLAVQAYLRHHHTDYEEKLVGQEAQGGLSLDNWTYHEIKAEANAEVRDFLRRHRRVEAPDDQDQTANEGPGDSAP